jgi:polysaccharide pyruvyl transferase WcaK-like protein
MSQHITCDKDREIGNLGLNLHQSSSVPTMAGYQKTFPAISTVQKPSKKLGLFGLFGVGNFGNDGSLEAMIVFLRNIRPDAELVCICAEPKRIQTEYHVLTLPINWQRPETFHFRLLNRLFLGVPGKLLDFFQTFKQVRDLDVLIVPGTGILDDFGERPGGMPYALFRTFLVAKMFGTKILLVSIGAGPIRHSISRWLMTNAARLADYRSYRDVVSKDFMDSIGIDTRNDPIYPDIAFKLPTPQAPDCHTPNKETLTVGVGVMTYQGWRYAEKVGLEIYSTYLSKLTQFVIWLLDRGCRVRIFGGDKGDQQAAADLLQALTRERRQQTENIVNEPVGSLHDVMCQMSQIDILVATRFHNVVCALMMEKPLISIKYADKNDALMADMGLEGFCQHIERIDVNVLIDQFGKLVTDRERYKTRIRETKMSYQNRLRHQDEFLLSNFLSLTSE